MNFASRNASFLPRDAMQSAVLLRQIVRPSVCTLPVRGVVGLS